LVADEGNERGEPVLKRWRRWMKVVFAPHVGPTGPGVERAVEFEIRSEGVRSVKQQTKDGVEVDGNDLLP
jgi:DNA repair protein RAD57